MAPAACITGRRLHLAAGLLVGPTVLNLFHFNRSRSRRCWKF
jgi:hypothetical protein